MASQNPPFILNPQWQQLYLRKSHSAQEGAVRADNKEIVNTQNSNHFLTASILLGIVLLMTAFAISVEKLISRFVP